MVLVELARAAVAGVADRTAAAAAAVAALECAGSALEDVCTGRALAPAPDRAHAEDPLRRALAAARAAVTVTSYAVVEADDDRRLRAARGGRPGPEAPDPARGA